MTDFLPVILNQPLGRQQYSHEFKRQIVKESMTLGVSIAAVARSHGINANLLHKWRSRYRHGEFGGVTASSTLTTVQIVNPARLAIAKPSQPTTIRTKTTPSSYIELHFSNTRVLVHGAPDSQTLRSVIDALRL